MDVVMPGVDGYEGCREIKRLQRRQVLPVVMLTSKSSPFDRIRGRMAGCDAYLAKPVDDEELKHVLARVLNAQREQLPAGGVFTVAAAT
jgi:twitching motility two-component system response regulator PilG